MISNSSIKNYFIQDQIVQNQVQFKINKYHHRSNLPRKPNKTAKTKKKKSKPASKNNNSNARNYTTNPKKNNNNKINNNNKP